MYVGYNLFIGTYIHTYIHTYIKSTYAYVYIYIYVHVYVCVAILLVYPRYAWVVSMNSPLKKLPASGASASTDPGPATCQNVKRGVWGRASLGPHI